MRRVSANCNCGSPAVHHAEKLKEGVDLHRLHPGFGEDVILRDALKDPSRYRRRCAIAIVVGVAD